MKKNFLLRIDEEIFDKVKDISGVEDRDKLISEYEKLIDRLEKAEKWASDNNYCWEFVKAHKYKIWHERDNIIKEIEFVRELLELPN